MRHKLTTFILKNPPESVSRIVTACFYKTLMDFNIKMKIVQSHKFQFYTNCLCPGIMLVVLERKFSPFHFSLLQSEGGLFFGGDRLINLEFFFNAAC